MIIYPVNRWEFPNRKTGNFLADFWEKHLTKYKAMENQSKEVLGTEEAWNPRMDGKAVCVGFVDHYQAVAKTTGLHKISKEILTNRGLVSCFDYYLN